MKASIMSSASSAVSMRGLTVFISDIRQCQSKEAEQKRVDKELAHIRQKFLGDSVLNSYQRKKYVWKMLYIHMLGYELDFGHMEAINLVSAQKYSEKNVGYLACTLLLHEEHELLALLINSMRNDLLSNNEHFQTLALACICNIGSKEFSEALAPDVMRILSPGTSSRTTKHVVKKRACLCLLRLFRKVPEILTPEEWSERMISLLDERNMGVLTSVLALLLGITARNPDGYEDAIPKLIRILNKYVVQKEYPTEYTYYQLPSPWLQVKLLRVLQCFPPVEDRQMKESLHKVLQLILNNTEMHKNVNKNNAVHAVFFEAIRLVIHLGSSTSLLGVACNLLGKYVTIKDANLRYIGLQAMASMAEKNDVAELLGRHQVTIQQALFKETDISIRKRCLDLLFSICDNDSVKEIVNDLLRFLEKADFLIKEEVVIKIAVLSERHATDLNWYVDVHMRLISLAGDFVAEDVWWRVVQIVTNNESAQGYAANKVLEELKKPQVHENMVRLASHILGEYADLVVNQGTATPEELYGELNKAFGTTSPSTKSMLLTAYAKLATMFPQLQGQVKGVFDQFAPSLDAELQQRSAEYLLLVNSGQHNLQAAVFEVMPAFPEKQESAVVKLMKRKKKGAITDEKEGGEVQRERGASTVEPSDRESREDRDRDGDSRRPPPRSRIAVSPQVEPEPAAPVVSTLLDLGGDPEPQAPGYGQTPASPPSTGLDALFDTTTTQPQQGMYGQPQGGANTEALRNHEIAVQRMRGQPAVDGVLYEDQTIQVGAKIAYQKHQAKMALYYGNKLNSAFSNFRSNVESRGGLDMQHKPPPNVVGGMQQAQHLAMVQCTEPFAECPVLALSFMVNGQPVNLQLKLPFSVTHFFEPANYQAQEFFQLWNQTTGGGKDRQEIFPARDTAAMQKDSMARVVQELRLSSLNGVDPNPNNVVAAGVCNTKSGVHAVLGRIEANARDGLLRVSVRSASPVAADSAVALLKTALGKAQ